MEKNMVNGLSGQRMLIALAIGIIFLIIMVLKTKIQAFLALIVTTVLVGVIGGMPLLNITLEDGKTFGIINSITSGFGGTLGSIGIIIGFGVMMGQIFEVTGAAKRMAYTFLKLFGKGREEEALALVALIHQVPAIHALCLLPIHSIVDAAYGEVLVYRVVGNTPSCGAWVVLALFGC